MTDLFTPLSKAFKYARIEGCTSRFFQNGYFEDVNSFNNALHTIAFHAGTIYEKARVTVAFTDLLDPDGEELVFVGNWDISEKENRSLVDHYAPEIRCWAMGIKPWHLTDDQYEGLKKMLPSAIETYTKLYERVIVPGQEERHAE